MRHVRLTSIKLLALSVLTAFAGVSFAGEMRIGYVNVSKVIEEAPQSISALKKLELEFVPRDKELVALQNRIRLLEDELQKNATASRSNMQQKTEREILTLKRELKRTTQDFREDYNQRRNEELSGLQQTVQRAILEIAKQEKYDLIMNEGVLHASDAIDITDKVLRKLGKHGNQEVQ